MNAKGKHQTDLTNHLYVDGSPSWSPDGKKIAFQTNRDGNSEVYVMNANGTHQRDLTDNAGADGWPSWQTIPATPTPSPSPYP